MVSIAQGHWPDPTSPDPTSNVAIVKVHEELVQITVLTGPQGGPR